MNNTKISLKKDFNICLMQYKHLTKHFMKNFNKLNNKYLIYWKKIIINEIIHFYIIVNIYNHTFLKIIIIKLFVKEKFNIFI